MNFLLHNTNCFYKLITYLFLIFSNHVNQSKFKSKSDKTFSQPQYFVINYHLTETKVQNYFIHYG